MVKNIKKSFKYLIIVIGIIIAFPMMLSLVISIPDVQTFIVRRITNHFSEEIRSTISVGKLEYRFFNRLSMYDILIKDQNDDTLLYSRKIVAGIKSINMKNKIFSLGRIIIINPVVSLITDSSGVMNLNWYLDILRSPEDTTSKTEKSSVRINQIDISNARFSLVNRTAEGKKREINFNNLHLTGINGIIEDLIVQDDTISFSIYNLGFRESGGFTLRKMNSDLAISKHNLLFSSAFLNCDSTILNIPHLEIHGDSSASFKNFIRDIRLDLQLDRSLVSLTELQYFVPFVKGMNETVWLSGRIFGTVSELRGRNVEMTYRDRTVLDCDFDFSGLPDFDNTFMHIGVNKLISNATDLEKICLPGKGPLKVPDPVHKMGDLAFSGSFTGFTTDFVTYGKLRTDAGTMSTDISLRPEESNRFRVKGLVTGSSIALGKLTGKNDLLGNLSMNADIDGYTTSFKNFSGNLTGKIDSVEINGYKYRNISLNGTFSENIWDGEIKIAEENIRMDLLGMLNFSKELPEFDFTLNIAKANLSKLNFDKSDTTSSVSMLLTANFRGNNIDNIDGEIRLLNSTLKKYGNTLELYDFNVKTFFENNKPAINLHTDFMDADLKGDYNFAGLKTAFGTALSSLMPSRFPSTASRNELINNNFTFNIYFRNTDKINNFFRTGILFAEKSRLSGIIYPDSIIMVKGEARSLTIKNNIFKDFSLNAKLISSEFSALISSSSLNLLGQSELIGFSAGLDMKPDSFVFDLNWDNNDRILNRGNFVARGNYIKSDKPGANAVLKIGIGSTGIYSRNNLWKINNSFIHLDSNSVNIDRLYISNQEHYYLIDGTLSENPADTLELEFRGIDISPLDYLAKKKNVPDQLPLSFKGQLNGDIRVTNIYKNPLIESNLKVSNFSMLQSEYGDLSIISDWNSEKKVAEIRASNNLDSRKMLDIAGYYDPSLKSVSLTAVANNLPVDALNPLLKVFASGITGTATGKVNFSGGPGNFSLKGALMAQNATMKIDYLQTKYKLNDSIRFRKNAIDFRNVKLTDEKGNGATLSGSVNHINFKDFSADLMINTKDCMVLNTKPKDNELFYGTAYASGVTTIRSGPSSLSFEISAKTGKNTKFYIPLNTGETISDYTFISFISHDTASAAVENQANNALTTASGLGIDLNFDLEVTPDAEVQLIFDPKVGDIMKGKGSGNLNINLNRRGDLKISGDYIIEEGEYLFTLQNIINKPFSVERGGKIIFNGDIDNAEIDLKATYKNLKASLFPILQDERFNERIPVECQIYLTGELFNPIIKFNIYLPTADESTRTYLKNAITTEEELNRQFLYLLVMNSFYSEQSSESSLSSPSAGTSAMAVTTAEMISNQLSNWISQISNDFDLGFVYRPGRDINPQEVQVALSTQLLNDRVTINGNFDVRGTGGTSQNVDQLTGDFDVEYKLTDKIRFKVFNRFNNPYTGKQAPYTQGFGVFYKQDFDKFADLFRKKEKPDMKREEEPSEN